MNRPTSLRRSPQSIRNRSPSKPGRNELKSVHTDQYHEFRTLMVAARKAAGLHVSRLTYFRILSTYIFFPSLLRDIP